ncbi:hypothetical protein HYT56_00225 [Candidatus Woesearchaeota archaeon]|nr:hypothetical protein [Candidatus Woesearchaeota archaeon]
MENLLARYFNRYEMDERYKRIDRIMTNINSSLKSRGLNSTDFFVTENRNDGFRIYVSIDNLCELDFFLKYLGKKKITLGHMCEIEVIKLKK